MAEPLLALVEAWRLLAAAGHRVMLVGAVAREISFDSLLADRVHRATRDVDAAVRLPDWAQYEQVARILTHQGGFRRLEADGLKFVDATGVELDLLPFGEIADEDDVLRWPNDPHRTLSLKGFLAADATATETTVGGVVVRVPTLPSLVALKLEAWCDRGPSESKDLEDLVFVLEHATEALGDRVFDELDGDVIAAVPYDGLGAFLLGRDLRTTVGRDHAARLGSIVTGSVLFAPDYRALGRVVGGSHLEVTVRRFETFCRGLLGEDKNGSSATGSHPRSAR